MRNKKFMIFILILVLAGGFVFVRAKIKNSQTEKEAVRKITPVRGSIQNVTSTTGTVLPQNRLEIKPPVNGRVESIAVQEGEKVKTGQVVAWMSSTERAALLDAAHGQGEETLKYWKEVYKAIPLISPIDGEVIVATTQPGQTVTTSDAVIVLSDHLIVRAQVDETDIGNIKEGQKAVIALDAYPDTKIKAAVEHIYHESKTVNNVTIYEVDLLPESVPPFFRSGMNATVDFIVRSKEDILIVPLEAVIRGKEGDYILAKDKNGQGPVRTAVKLGISDDKNVELVSGVAQDDIILIKSKKFSLPKSSAGTNPFLPARRR